MHQYWLIVGLCLNQLVELNRSPRHLSRGRGRERNRRKEGKGLEKKEKKREKVREKMKGEAAHPGSC